MRYIILAFLISNSFSLHSQSIWHQTNGPQGGYGSYFALDSSGRLFVCSVELYSSTNNAETWSRHVITSEGFSKIQFHPNGSIFALDYIYKILRSTDNGSSWQTVFQNQNASLTEMLIGPGGNIFTSSLMDGLIRSTDNGQTWKQVIKDINIRSLNYDKIGRLFAGGLWGGLYRSIDSGFSWHKIAFNDTSVYSIAFDSLNNMFICREANVYKSSDGGISWSFAGTGLPLWQGLQLFISSKDYLFAGAGFGIYRSTNKGVSWEQFNNGIDVQYIESFFEDHNGNIYAASVGNAVLKTTNDGQSWVIKNNGIYSSWIQSTAIVGPGYVIAGAGNEGLYYSTNSGINWLQSNVHVSNQYANYNSIAMDSTGVFYASEYQSLYKSIDSGRTWSYLSLISSCDILNLEVNGLNHIFASCDLVGIRRSTNGGYNWSTLSVPLGSAVAFGINYNGDIYCKGSEAIYRSTNEGDNWINVLPNFHEGAFYNVFAFSKNGEIYFLSDQKVRRSTNNGQSWQIVYNSQEYFCNLIIDQYNSMFILSTETRRIYMSTDHGSNWSDVSSGLEAYPYNLSIGSDGVAFVGTSRGVYTNINPIGIVNAGSILPSDFYLYQNFPNPFNPSTKINIDVPKESFVELKIYDVTGRVVSVLNNSVLRTGKYDFEWNATEYSSGIYFYTLQAGDFLQTRKMVLLK